VLEFFEKPSVLIIVVLIIIVFGAKRLPDSARALGRSMRILKAEAKGLKDDDGAPGQVPVTQASLPPVHPAQPAAQPVTQPVAAGPTDPLPTTAEPRQH
jgi:sec-independent protein translocase protein TatA